MKTPEHPSFSSDRHPARQALERRLMDAMDGQLDAGELRRLEKELEAHPDLKEDAAMLGIRFDSKHAADTAFSTALKAAFPAKRPPENRLQQLRTILHHTPSDTPASLGFGQQVWRWFPAYITAAALVLLSLIGMYSIQTSPDADAPDFYEWIYAADVQQAFSDESLMADEAFFDPFFPQDSGTPHPLTEPSDEH